MEVIVIGLAAFFLYALGVVVSARHDATRDGRPMPSDCDNQVEPVHQEPAPKRKAS